MVIIISKADCVIALADAAHDEELSAAVAGLKSSAQALDYKLDHNLVPPLQRDAAHEALEDAQALLTDMCDNQNIQDKVPDVEAAKAAIDAFLP